MKTTEQSPEEMRATLVERALTITKLSMEIRGKGLANAWAEYYGHVDTFDARVQPVDGVHEEGIPSPENLAKVYIRFYFHDGWDEGEVRTKFLACLEEVDQHIAFLDLILAKGQPILTEAQEGAA